MFYIQINIPNYLSLTFLLQKDGYRTFYSRDILFPMKFYSQHTPAIPGKKKLILKP